MVDWRALEPLSAAGLLGMAQQAARDTRSMVDVNARISHVGFRSRDHGEWERLQAALAESGEVFSTRKADGRNILFVKLAKPLPTGGEGLVYVELPAPKPVADDKASIVVVYTIVGENRVPQMRGGYEVREQSMGAAGFIERDKGRPE